MNDWNTAARCSGSRTGVATAGRSARTPFLRWKVKFGLARRLANQLRRTGGVELR
jgi:hypothetical protein